MNATTTNYAASIAAAGKKLASIHPTAPAVARARKWWAEGRDESTAKKILVDLQSATLVEYDAVEDYVDGDPCPVHETPFRKAYVYGSKMTIETEVCVFRGCGCAIRISENPGAFQSVPKYHGNFDGAAGEGRFHAMQGAVKFR
jgi:hypothetical protein